MGKFGETVDPWPYGDIAKDAALLRLRFPKKGEELTLYQEKGKESR